MTFDYFEFPAGNFRDGDEVALVPKAERDEARRVAREQYQRAEAAEQEARKYQRNASEFYDAWVQEKQRVAELEDILATTKDRCVVYSLRIQHLEETLNRFLNSPEYSQFIERINAHD